MAKNKNKDPIDDCLHTQWKISLNDVKNLEQLPQDMISCFACYRYGGFYVLMDELVSVQCVPFCLLVKNNDKHFDLLESWFEEMFLPSLNEQTQYARRQENLALSQDNARFHEMRCLWEIIN